MTKDLSPATPPDLAEETRKLIREFVETPPAKTIADVKAASEIYEANAAEQSPKNIEVPQKPRT